MLEISHLPTVNAHVKHNQWHSADELDMCKSASGKLKPIKTACSRLLVCPCFFLSATSSTTINAGSKEFTKQGWIRPVYFTILISHIILAFVIVPLALRTLYLAWRERFEAHRRIAKITFPIWLYVSVTGVLIYLMLYQL